MKLKLLTLLSIAALVFASCNGGSKKQQANEQPAENQEAEQINTKPMEPAFNLDSLSEEPVFDIVTNMGTITVKLYKETPQHRDNFAKLASERYYNGILFHRVINGFMIQSGDPNTRDTTARPTWGRGGPGYTIPAEFIAKFKHKKGALAAARKGDAANPQKESSGSQFYLVQSAESCAQLDGEYTVFGETIKGIDIIDKIASVPTNNKDVPNTPIVIESVNLVKEQ